MRFARTKNYILSAINMVFFGALIVAICVAAFLDGAENKAGIVFVGLLGVALLVGAVFYVKKNKNKSVEIIGDALVFTSGDKVETVPFSSIHRYSYGRGFDVSHFISGYGRGVPARLVIINIIAKLSGGYFTSASYYGPVLMLKTQDKKNLPISQEYQNAKELINQILAKINPALTTALSNQIAAGNSVSCGKITLSPTTITFMVTATPYTSLNQMLFDKNYLRIVTSEGKTYKRLLSQIDNLFAVTAVCEKFANKKFNLAP